MARLAQLGHRLSSAPLRAARAAQIVTSDLSRVRDAEHPIRKNYKTAKWQRLRWSVLERDLFTCQRPDCRKVEADTSKLVADHIIAHRGDEALFWAEANLQCLCKACHDSAKQREERGADAG